MKTLSELKKNIVESLGYNDSKGHKIAVVLALVFVSSLLLGYYFVSRSPPEGYNTIYLLDYQHRKAIDYPELLVIAGNRENSTVSVWVVVENHMGRNQSYQLLQKVVRGSILSFPVEADAEQSYMKTLGDGEKWEILATVSLNEPGSYSVVFELWVYDAGTEAFVFSYNYCVLNIDAIERT